MRDFLMSERVKVGAEFCGWQTIHNLYDLAKEGRGKRLVLTLFKTGGRISEVLSLSSDDISYELSQNSVVVRIKVLKKQEALTRSIPIPKSEPLTSEWIQSLEGVKGLLFQGQQKHRPLDRTVAWRSVKVIGADAGMNISDHWFRGMRASELADDYQFEPYDLRQFFKWTKKKQDMAERYASMSWRGLERRMFESMPAEWKVKP